MQRQGADPENMSAEDFLCDFCLRCWAPQRPMVEGHRGSLVCGECLAEAHRAVVVRGEGISVPDPEACALCLMHKDEPHWRSTKVEARPVVCRTCIKRSGAILEKDPDSGWKRPE
ncbi:hypothetical protein PHYC_03308 [Phycisphaerales bacterium]|nr:hypothetical protein PHYC_03308 [Phycisphaerales bacterium]